MIVSFRHRELQRHFERGDPNLIRSDLLDPDLLDKVDNILAVLSRATTPEQMSLPGFRLQALKGGRAGQWAATVSAKWRIVWRFEGADAAGVDLVEYR